MSASKMRKAAAENDFETFRKGVPQSLDDKVAKQLFNTVKKQMNVKEGWRMWEIAPKFDWQNLRENYVSGKIFNVNQLSSRNRHLWCSFRPKRGWNISTEKICTVYGAWSTGDSKF